MCYFTPCQLCDRAASCLIVVPGNEMEANNRYLQGLGRKVPMIATEPSKAQVCIQSSADTILIPKDS